MQTICVLFGGVSPEHDISLRSAEAVLNHMKSENRSILPIGITKEGKWLLYGGSDYAEIAANTWELHPKNREAFLSPVRGMGLCIVQSDGTLKTVPVDVVFPVLHGENGEDGTIQGLFEIAGIPYVGCGVLASAASMDKSVTKLMAGTTGVRQADWLVLLRHAYQQDPKAMCAGILEKLSYPIFIKPCSTGSSVGVSKVKSEEQLQKALECAFRYDEKVLAEEFIHGKEIEVAVLGNQNPIAATAGEIDAGAEFYDFETKYVTTTSRPYIPARIDDSAMASVREWAVKIYQALSCKGLSRVDFFVTYDTNEVVFNEINTLPGFTSISMYPKMFAADGVSFSDLIERVIALALED
ncbi:MAG: D-alanine--D-alanine ligase [Oscillospiraceae bacterium]|nr:D-alanine--D-alanine ligase [Oscillospiraceae bacterium]